MNIRKSREREERKNAILKAAVRVFSSKGFIRTTVSDIAREAGFSKSALYFYFGGKEEIFIEIIKKIITDFKEFIEKLGRETISTTEKIEKLFNTVLNYVEEKREIITILYSETHSLYSFKGKRFKGILQKYKGFFIKGMKSILSQGIDKGTIRDCDIELLATVLRGMLTSLVIYRMNGGKKTNKECIEFVMDILRNGLIREERREKGDERREMREEGRDHFENAPCSSQVELRD
ncbi:MAG: TetR/AcrR family transcriptional regulator [candidate division WOR-3 bacterium]|nr:TetR/AcrR family transcriptional regulator [candidate division WOR-3 bacterium]